MRFKIEYMVAVVIVLCGNMAADATSTPPFRLTPDNLGARPHQIKISANERGGEIQFHVTISAKKPKAHLEVVWGYLYVYDGGRLVCRCRTHAQTGKSKVIFEFDVAPSVLEKSRFSFTAATAPAEERKKMPAGAGWVSYEFTLQDFVRNGDKGRGGRDDGDSK